MKYIYLAKQYNLVTHDKFELFYRGIIKLFNPYEYYILVRCIKGTPYPRYYTYTPKEGEEGSYELSVEIIDNEGKVIDKGVTTLIVEAPNKPSRKVNILCFGDSLTVNGVWVSEAYRRICCENGTPLGLNYGECLNMMGTCKKEVDNKLVGYEGYGGWTWKSYCINDHYSPQSAVWIKCKHHKSEKDQHSIWQSANLEWILETIESNRLKFKRGNNNYNMVPPIGEVFTHMSNAFNQEDIMVEGYEFEKGNPFWNKQTNQTDFKDYVNKNSFEEPDLIYILLTWNGLYIPYNTDFRHHTDCAKILIDKIHKDFPNCLIRVMGVQICSVNGGIATNYGASGYYSDTFGTISTAFNYNDALEQMCLLPEYQSFVKYIDTKAQFDTEYNMPMTKLPVNARSSILENIGTNGVHPTIEGYLQIGDVFYRSLIHDLNKL